MRASAPEKEALWVSILVQGGYGLVQKPKLPIFGSQIPCIQRVEGTALHPETDFKKVLVPKP